MIGRPFTLVSGELNPVHVVEEMRWAIVHEKSYSTTVDVCSADGRRMWVALSSSPVRDNDGRVTHYVDVFGDVTQRIEFEQKLIRRTNPTRLPLSEAERARRYALKCRLQAELILRFGEELAPTPCADGVVALSCRSGRGDGGHAKLERLPPEARDWRVARLGLRE